MAIVIEHYRIIIDINRFWREKTLVTEIGTWTHDILLTQTEILLVITYEYYSYPHVECMCHQKPYENALS